MQQRDGSRFPLIGATIDSETHPGVRYYLERGVGEGGMGTAYLARRESDGGSSPVVVKIMRLDPAGAGVAPELVALKETVALGRLNEALPPSPFVVRLVDSGVAPLRRQGRTPWTAIEYVHGGVEGTTLEDRVTYSVHKTGYAFDAVRTAHALRCLAAGLSSIHGVGVIHRDVTPGNILCCGFGVSEIFKIADFGVARAAGLNGTFDDACLGTMGYSAPEAATDRAGPATDVFALAGVVYYMLTGQRYFTGDSPVAVMRQAILPGRSRVADHETLAPELAQASDTCAAIDEVLARATDFDPQKRPETPGRFAAELLDALGEQNSGPRSTRQLLSAVQSSPRGSAAAYRFSLRSRGQKAFDVHSAAFDADGHALALEQSGGRFWNGDTWLDAAPLLAKLPGKLRFVQRCEAGGWLVGGDAVSVVDSNGVIDSLSAPGGGALHVCASGRPDDLLLAAGVDHAGNVSLWPIVARRFLRPIPLPGVQIVNAVQQLDDRRFLVGGRTTEGTAYAARVSPLEWQVQRLDAPAARAFIGGAGAPERSTAFLTGTGGVVLRVAGETVAWSVIPGEPHLSAGATDVLGRQWATSTGALWTRDEDSDGAWKMAWADDSLRSPFITVLAEPGHVFAMTVDGTILEGRAPVAT